MEELYFQGRSRLSRATLSTIIMVAVLFAVRLVVVGLPVFRSTSLVRSSQVDVAGILSGAISFLVALAVVNYSFHVDAALKMMTPRFPAV